MFPGIIGTILNGKANNIPSGRIPSSCARSFDEMRVWINIGKIVDYSCFKSYFSQDFDPKTCTWSDLPGMTYNVPQWGSTYSVDTLDPAAPASLVTTCFHNVINGLKKVGYVDGQDMTGCGYDWRQGPSREWAEKCRVLIESMVNRQNGKKAIIVGHSMGAPFSYFFLRTMGSDWVSKYIHKYIVVSPAWAGATKALDFMIDGLDSSIPIGGKFFAPMCRHLPSVWFLLPWEDAFQNMVLATTPSRNYTFSQVNKLLEDLGAEYVSQKRQSVFNGFDYKKYSVFPGVPVISVIGKGVKTTQSLMYTKDIVKGDPEGDWTSEKIVTGDGDGTVPIKSLEYATNKWSESGHSGSIKVKYMSGAGHVEALRSSEFVQLVVGEACDS